MNIVYCHVCGAKFETPDPGEIYCSDTCEEIDS
jgi:predicted nucleic acid-binding Zn ribbon protein